MITYLDLSFESVILSRKDGMNCFTLLHGGGDERVLVLLGTNTGDTVDIPVDDGRRVGK
jgi:hypothetical protein